MESLKQIKLGVGLLFFVSAPTYLVYDFRKITQGQANLFHWLMFLIVGFLAGFLLFWFLRIKGQDYLRLKSLWERPIALLMLVFSTPLLLVTALLIKLESPGPVIYSQARIGRNERKRERRRLPESGQGPPWDRRKSDRRRKDLGGKPFLIYKLRSMTHGAEQNTGVAWSTGDHDPRVTRVGYYIRKIHIDELPQLYNVLLGQMSVIGPRPERPDFILQLSNMIEGYRDRLCVLPGITGLSQVLRDHDESLEDVKEKLGYDREYIRNVSFLLELRIVLQTIILIASLLWNALMRRTIGRVEPKTLDTLVPENSRPESG